MNIRESENYLFITNNEERIDSKIINKKFDEHIADISSVAFAESDEEEEKEGKIIEYVIVQKLIRKKVN